jgi:hypothetical protein
MNLVGGKENLLALVGVKGEEQDARSIDSGRIEGVSDVGGCATKRWTKERRVTEKLIS